MARTPEQIAKAAIDQHHVLVSTGECACGRIRFTHQFGKGLSVQERWSGHVADDVVRALREAGVLR